MAVSVAQPRYASGNFDMVQVFAILQAISAVLLSSGWITYLLDPGSAGDVVVEDRTSGSPIVQLVSLAVYLPAVLFMLARPLSTVQTIARGWSYSLLVALAIASVFWSVAPDVTARRSIALLISTLFVVHAANWFRPREFVQIVGYVLVGLCLLSIIAAAIPGYGIHPSGVHVGRWRGIFASKNLFGMIAAFAAITMAYFAICASARSRGKISWSLGVIIAFVLCYFSNARTSLVGLIAAFAGIYACRLLFSPVGWQRRLAKQTRFVIVGGAIALFAFIVPAAAAVILTLLGRDLTLTGRQKLWQYALDKGMNQFWTGAGFKSFWTDIMTYDLRILHQYWSEEGETLKLTSNAHNGYLDVWLELGISGLLLLLIMLFTAVYRSLKGYARTNDGIYLWFLGVTIFVMNFYLTNGFIMMHNVMMWFIMSYVFYALAYLRLDLKKQVE